jgi:uncharacterized membrane protein YqjE
MITDGGRMRADEDDQVEVGEMEDRGWADRLSDVAAQAGDLLKTRFEIFREEAAEKAEHAARGAAGMAIAIGLAAGAILLLAALLVAVLAKLFGSLILGVLGAFVLFAGGAALFGWRASVSLGRVRPGEFPATRAELLRDAEAIREALSIGVSDDDEPGPGGSAPDSRGEGEVEDLEARVRAGAE